MARRIPGYTVWSTALHTGDVRDLLGEYSNRGHAVSRIKGLRRRAWLARSEATYKLRDDSKEVR